MKNKRIIFGSSVEYYDPSMGLKEWDRPTIEFDIEDGEDFLENLHKAKAIVKEFFKGSLKPEDDSTATKSYIPKDFSLKERPLRNTDDHIIEDIKSCKDVKTLESYKLIAKSNPTIQSAYQAKLNELSK